TPRRLVCAPGTCCFFMISRTGFLSKRKLVMKMRNWFRPFWANQPATHSEGKMARRRPCWRAGVEMLEDRSLPTVSAAPVRDPSLNSRISRNIASETNQFSLSSDGRYVAFTSAASNLVSGDTNARLDIFVYDRQSQATERVSVGLAGTEANSDSWI